MSSFYTRLEFLCRWLLIIIFLVAGVPKLLDLRAFAGVIDAYGLLPESLVYPSAFIIASLEVVAAVGLFLKKRFALHLTTILMCIFIGVLTYGIVLGLDIDCGCFSQNDPEFKAFSGLKTALFRDFVLLIPLVYLYLQTSLTKISAQY